MLRKIYGLKLVIIRRWLLTQVWQYFVCLLLGRISLSWRICQCFPTTRNCNYCRWSKGLFVNDVIIRMTFFDNPLLLFFYFMLSGFFLNWRHLDCYIFLTSLPLFNPIQLKLVTSEKMLHFLDPRHYISKQSDERVCIGNKDLF